MPATLSEITICGFKSIAELNEFKPGPLNVLIGANGAGKSNFFGFFRMLNWMLTPPGQLQHYVRTHGGAASFLHDGPWKTRLIQTWLKLTTSAGSNIYKYGLKPAGGDSLHFQYEKLENAGTNFWELTAEGSAESVLNRPAEAGELAPRAIARSMALAHITSMRISDRRSRRYGRWFPSFQTPN